jgi:hypothetical protein
MRASLHWEAGAGTLVFDATDYYYLEPRYSGSCNLRAARIGLGFIFGSGERWCATSWAHLVCLG